MDINLLKKKERPIPTQTAIISMKLAYILLDGLKGVIIWGKKKTVNFFCINFLVFCCIGDSVGFQQDQDQDVFIKSIKAFIKHQRFLFLLSSLKQSLVKSVDIISSDESI